MTAGGGEHFTPRQSSGARARYLGIIGLPDADYVDPGTPVTLPPIPRYSVFVAGMAPPNPFAGDVPYQFPAVASIDGGDGSVDPVDLDLAHPAFNVFRIPAATPADVLQSFRADYYTHFAVVVR